MKRFLTLALAMFVAASTAVFAADMPKVGDKAPEFTLTSGEGNQISLKDYKGK
jgi:peroxiredoxin